MNTNLSTKHVELLINRFFIENRSHEIIFWSIITLIFTILDQRDFVIIVLYLSGLIFAARLYKDLWIAPADIHYLMIPATHAEKITAAIILNTLYYFIMTLLAYAIGNLLITLIYHVILKIQIPVNWDLFQSTNSFFENGLMQVTIQNEFWRIFGTFATIQALSMVGSLYFKRNPTVKTIFSIICILLILLFIQLFLFKTIWDIKHVGNAFLTMITMVNDSTIPTTIYSVLNFASYLILPFLWILSYFRLSEKQV